VYTGGIHKESQTETTMLILIKHQHPLLKMAHTISNQYCRDISNLNSSQMKDFYTTVVPMEINTPAKCYCSMDTTILRADIQNCQNKCIFWAQNAFEKVA
jgi:hypothetical protein